MSGMKPLSKKAQDILSGYVAALAPGQDIRLVAPSMLPICIERIAQTRISVACYGEQNGDAMRDPDICFLASPDGSFYPYSFRNDYLGMAREYVNFGPGDVPVTWEPAKQRDLAGFASDWLIGIAAQYTVEPREVSAS